jgi:hypothetical protein
MPDAERAKFRRDAITLLKAGWNTGKIADWALSAASGFGRFWNSREHALQEANTICREINSVRRAAARNDACICDAGFGMNLSCPIHGP